MRNPTRGGFTLIELLVVITVLAILASLVTPMVFRNIGDAKATTARTQMEVFSLALDSYRLDNDYYPSTAQGLEALRSAPAGEPEARNWRGPYLKKVVPLDPWGRPYMLQVAPDGRLVEVVSLGADGQPGGQAEAEDLYSSNIVAIPDEVEARHVDQDPHHR